MCALGNMKEIYRHGYYDGSIELRDVFFNRRCVKCGRGDFGHARRMRIRKGIVFWNLVFSLMFTCVTGTKPLRQSRKICVSDLFSSHDSSLHLPPCLMPFPACV